MKCPICKHGHRSPAKVTITLDRGPVTVVFKNVPAEVCSNCGEQFVDEKTTASLIQQAEATAKSGVAVEVRSFAA
ncbi:MAG: type II toxin-antitoxin system MqsA family antitoxin [Phycisphaerales bacterium]|jgi:YgiT-type zinc finger domain-containing protein